MTPIDRLIAACAERRLKVAVCGDGMHDEYVHGELFGCQDACPKFVIKHTEVCDGGAANAENTLKHWNIETRLFTLPGCFPRKRRYLVDGKIVFREDHEIYGYGIPSHKIAAERVKLMQAVREFEPDAILVSDYHKGTISETLMTELTVYAQGRAIPIVSDGCREPAFYAGTILKCNEAYQRKYHPTIRHHNLLQVVTTYGGEVPRLDYSDTDDPTQWCSQFPVPAIPLRAVNHVGAGDCFGAHLLLGLAHGLPLADAAAIAHSAGRVYVQHAHNRAPWAHEIRKDIDPVGGKVVAVGTATHLRESTAGRVVFANGVFRVPHAGHAHLLNWAKSQGSCLVVGINDDESAQRQRPGEYVMPLAERCAVLASMVAVDWIIPFADDTPTELIRDLRPHLLVKGPEYAGSDVPGSELVEEVLFCPPGPDVHATSLVEAIRGY